MLCVAIHSFQNIAQFYDDHLKRKDYDYSKLPPHIIANILSQLRIAEYRNASLTCKSWYYASFDPRVAKNIRVHFLHDATDCKYLVRPIHNACFNAVNLSKFHFRDILSNFGSTITDLQIYTNITMARLFELFVYLPNVRTLLISDGTKSSSPKNLLLSKHYSKHKDVIVRNLAQIKKIDVWVVTRDLRMFRLFLSYCINLVELNWSPDASLGSDIIYTYLLNKDENPALNKLVELQLNNIDRKQNSKFFEKMIHLELTNLKRLTIREISTTYYDRMFKEFCKTYKSIESLTLTGCNDQHLADICQHMKSIICLTIYSSIAINLSQLLNLKQLEELHIDRVDVVVSEELFLLLSCEHKLLKKFHINKIDSDLLKLICQNCKNLEDLNINELDTKNCEPIFRNMVKLKRLSLTFTELPTKNSSRIRSSDRYNITNLSQLEALFVSCYVPGITPELIEKLPKIIRPCDYIWDPTDEELNPPAWIEDWGDPEVVNNQLEIEESETVTYEISDFNWCQELILCDN